MTEKKAESPVQEPAPAPEAAGKIWKLQGKFPALADYLVFFGIFLLAQWNSSILPPVMPGDTRRALSIYKQQLASFVWDAEKLENNPFT